MQFGCLCVVLHAAFGVESLWMSIICSDLTKRLFCDTQWP
jgi:hypothetical protein